MRNMGAVRADQPWQWMPHWLRVQGIAAFGSAKDLEAAVASTRSPQLLTRTCGSVRLVEPPGDNSIIRLQWQRRGSYGLESLVPAENGTVVDVGGNIGAISMLLVKCHPTLRVVAYEAAPVTFFFMLWNCVLNNVPVRVGSRDTQALRRSSGIDAYNMAVARGSEDYVDISFNVNKTQDTVLTFMEHSHVGVLGCGRGKTGAMCQPLQRHVRVPAVNVLSHLEVLGVQIVDLLKIDCEGCEIPFLANDRIREWFVNKSRVRHVGAEIQCMPSLEQ